MLPRAIRAVNSSFASDSQAGVSQRGVLQPGTGDSPLDHHCQICPTCGQRLTGHRCKLVCAGCGYYMSCADYY
jgi:hypothetical protein